MKQSLDFAAGMLGNGNADAFNFHWNELQFQYKA